MSRTTQESSIQSPTARSRLAVRAEPYYRSLQRGLALGYRRGGRGGSWLARLRDPVRDGYTEIGIGPADDQGDKTMGGLTYDQAAARARDIFAEQQSRRASGAQPAAKKQVVGDVLDLYLAGYIDGTARRDGKPGRDLKNLKSILSVHIGPALGAVKVDQLNADLLEKFKTDLVNAPKLARNGKAANSSRNDAKGSTECGDVKGERLGNRDDEEELAEHLRKRRARANRVITVLRAALNYAVRRRIIATDAAWRTALKPYPDVDGATVRYLDLEECRTLQEHADEDFRPLVTAALFTGARYGSLRRLKVGDIDLRSRTALLRATKSGKKQTVRLTAAACKFLSRQVKGRSAGQYVFVKASGEPWKPSDQARRMAYACAKAGIEPTATFHELRDTFASHLVIAGVPILTVSRLLGHSDIRMTEKHYAHLRPDHLQQAVDDNLPDFSGWHHPQPVGGQPETLRKSPDRHAATRAQDGAQIVDA